MKANSNLSFDQLIAESVQKNLVDLFGSKEFQSSFIEKMNDTLQQIKRKEEKKYLTHSEAANYLGCKEATLYSLTSKGQIPYYKTPGRNLYKREELDSWIEKYRTSSNEELENQADAYLANKTHLKENSS